MSCIDPYPDALISATNKESDDGEFGLSEDERRKLVEEAELEIKKIQADNKETNAEQYKSADRSSSTDRR